MTHTDKQAKHATQSKALARQNLALARQKWPEQLDAYAIQSLRNLTAIHQFSILSGDLLFLGSGWYVTHTGLIRLARRKRCAGIHVSPMRNFSDPSQNKWVFRATTYTKRGGPQFVGYGDAEPSNISQAIRGAEMRVAETRAVNRALRKAYGIGICSVEELGSTAHPANSWPKMPAQSANGNGNNGNPKLRDRLCQLIRHHRLDANLVKSYAVDVCGIKTLREATREQVEAFVTHLSDWAEKDRDALLCQLNSYLPARSENEKAGAA